MKIYFIWNNLLIFVSFKKSAKEVFTLKEIKIIGIANISVGATVIQFV